VTKENVDRLAENLSSNWAKNFFGIIIKYSQGKRIYQGKTDSWEVRCYFAADMTSNEKFAVKILKSMGLGSSQIRELETARQAGKKRKIADAKGLEKNIKRRKVSKNKKLNSLAVNTKRKDQHKSDSLAPTDDCRSEEPGDDSNGAAQKPKPKPKSRQPRKCGNCKRLGHTKGACPEPDYSESEKKKKRKHLKFTNDRVASIL
jgi:hypothetical protein